MNEKNIPAPLPSKDSGANAATKPAENLANGKPTVQPVAVSPAPNSAPALFGGHRGGGKKRADGLPAGSDEAKEADRKKNADRMARNRAQEKAALAPSPLPSLASSPAGPALSLAPSPSPLSGAMAGLDASASIIVAPSMPAFVPWIQKNLERPAKLLTKIIDRWRCSTIMKRIRKLGLSKEQEKEIADDIRYKENIVQDFSTAISNAAAIELNKHRVPGAEYGHFIDVAMTGGELVMIHMDTIDKLEKMILANGAASPGASQKNV